MNADQVLVEPPDYEHDIPFWTVGARDGPTIVQVTIDPFVLRRPEIRNKIARFIQQEFSIRDMQLTDDQTREIETRLNEE